MTQTNVNEYFRLFFETAQGILSAQQLQQILDSLVQRTVTALGVKAGGLRLIDEKTNHLEQVAACGLSDTYLNKGALNADQSIPEVLLGKPVCVKNAPDDPRIQYPEALRTEGINTLLSVPVIAADKVIGVLRLYSAEERDFSAQELEFLSALAEIGGLAIANARLSQAQGSQLAVLFEEIGIDLPAEKLEIEPAPETCAFLPIDPEQGLAYFHTLHAITSALLSTLDSRQAVQLIVDRVIATMKVKACALRLRNETTHELELIAATGLSEKFLTKGKPHTDQSINATLAGEVVLILDTAKDSRLEYPAETVAEGIASILSVPIVARGRVIGVLRLYSGERREYVQAEISFLRALAEISGVAIMKAKLYEQTRNDLSFWKTTFGYLQD